MQSYIEKKREKDLSSTVFPPKMATIATAEPRNRNC